MGSESPQDQEVDIGAVLRSCRLRRGEDLLSISRLLRIRPTFLQAIEERRFGDLPGPTYAVGFVRAYAEHLGLDSGEVIRRFKGEISGSDASARLHFPSPRTEGGRPGWTVVVAGAMIALVSYGVWYANSSRDDGFGEFVASVPERLARLVSPDGRSDAGTVADPAPGTSPVDGSSPRLAAAASPAAGRGTDADRTDADRTDADRTDVAASGAGESGLEAATGAAVPTTTPETSSTEPVAPARSMDEPREVAAVGEDADPQRSQIEIAAPPAPARGDDRWPGRSVGDAQDGRIMLRATEESWIQVRDETADRVLLARLLRPGEVYHVPDRSGLNLWTGNAGGLEILVDGVAVPPIGEKGMVRRRVALEVEPLRDGSAVR